MLGNVNSTEKKNMMLGMIHDFVQCRHYYTAQNQSPEEDRFVNSIPVMHKTRQ